MKNSSPPSNSLSNINSKKVKVLDRKTVERKRRCEMKGLCFKLTSLIPPHHFKPSKELLSQQDQLDQAATYIKQLKERVDELKVKKEVVEASIRMNGKYCNSGIISSNNNNNTKEEEEEEEEEEDEEELISMTANVGSVKRVVVPAAVVELREFGSSLEVVLISSGSQNNFMLPQVIILLQEEGTDVLSLSFSTVGDRVFHTLHTQVKFSRVGVDTSRIRQRLQELMMHTTSFSQDI